MTNNVDIYPDSEGGWRFRVKAANHEIVASGESYSTKAGAAEGVQALRRALGLEEEWGVRTYHHIGEIDTAYWSRGTAEVMLDDIRDEIEAGELPENTKPSLIRRLVTDWEEVDD